MGSLVALVAVNQTMVLFFGHGVDSRDILSFNFKNFSWALINTFNLKAGYTATVTFDKDYGM